MMATKELTEQEIVKNIDKGTYGEEPIKAFKKYLAYSETTFELFKKDVVSLLISSYNFNANQSRIIFNRCWIDCSIGGLKSVLDETIDIALFTEEIVHAE